MAIVTGTNAGFVTVAPSIDPGGTTSNIVGRATGLKIVSPSGSNHIVELGWWQGASGNNAVGWEMALYTHDAVNNVPQDIVDARGSGTLTENTEEWNVDNTVDIALSASTTYWLVVQTAGNSSADCEFVSSGALRFVIDISEVWSALPEPYPDAPTAEFDDYNAAFYAKYEAVGGASIVVLRRRRAA